MSFDAANLAKQVVRFSHVSGEMTGLAFGTRKLNLKGSNYFIDEENLLFCRLVTGSIKIQQKAKEFKDSVEGLVVRLKKGTSFCNIE